MDRLRQNKKKIINDPVYGFINIPNDIIFDLIEHPYFQRLRRINQLGLSHLVYPGALHTRFHHSIGAMHLMQDALHSLKRKGIKITKEERLGATIAILLHDIGHGPFSHALEHSIIPGIQHEYLSEIFMLRLNKIFGGKLSTGISIFKHAHPRPFLSQLVSGQMDMDRLDYLTRDSFFTGVSEGIIGTQRIIKMLNVAKGNLVAEEKGIYSIEKFIISRRIMYWQVYLHKAVLSAENMLIKILERARWLSHHGHQLFATPELHFFLHETISQKDLDDQDEILDRFAGLDDMDIYTSVKVWCRSDDPILSYLCQSLINRHLFRCEIQTETFDYFYIENLKDRIKGKFAVSDEDMSYFFISDTTSNYAYRTNTEPIKILTKQNKVVDISDASDQIKGYDYTKGVTKHFICYPKDVEK